MNPRAEAPETSRASEQVYPAEPRRKPRERVEALYAENYERLRALACLLTGDISGGEDIAQDTFVEALRAERRQPGMVRDPAWPWLRTVAVRLASRRRYRLGLLTARLHLLTSLTSDVEWDAETADTLRALRALPRRMRACIVLAYLEDRTVIEIAASLSCSPKTVENQLREGRRRLRVALSQEDTHV